MYNEDYISDFDNSLYDKYLNSPSLLGNIKKIYLNKYSDNADTIFLGIKESLDHYVLKRISMDDKYIESNEFLNYMKYINDINDHNIVSIGNFKYYPEYYTNVVFRSNPELTNKILNRYYSNEDIKMIRQRITEYNGIIKSLYNKLDKDVLMSQNELNLIGDYIYNSRRGNKKFAQLFLKNIINLKQDSTVKSTPQIIGGVLSTLPYEFVVNNKNTVASSRIFIGKYDNGSEINIAHSRGSQKICCFDKKYIEETKLVSSESINKSRGFKENDLYHIMWIAFHELTHQHQNNSVKTEPNSSSALSYISRLIFDKYMPTKKTEKGVLCDYSINHDSDEIEIQADEEAQRQLRHLVAKYDKVDVSRYAFSRNEKEIQARRAISIKRDVNNENKAIFSTYDISNLEKIVKNHSDLLKEYPQLNSFFKSDGTIDVKNITVNFDYRNVDENNISRNDTNMFASEFLNYCISHKKDEVNKMLKDNDLSYEEMNKFSDRFYLYGRLYYKKMELLEKLDINNLDETNIGVSKSSIPKLVEKIYNVSIGQLLYTLEKYKKMDEYCNSRFNKSFKINQLNELLVKSVNGINIMRRNNIKFNDEVIQKMFEVLPEYHYSDVYEILNNFGYSNNEGMSL